MTDALTAGELINNPFDLEDFGIDWQGLDEPRHDARNFCRFKTRHDGLRAGLRDLVTAQHHGARTIEKLIIKFAPPSENDTEKYIANVCAWTGLRRDSAPALDMPEALITFGKAVIRQEQGRVIYADDEMMAAALAALERPGDAHHA